MSSLWQPLRLFKRFVCSSYVLRWQTRCHTCWRLQRERKLTCWSERFMEFYQASSNFIELNRFYITVLVMNGYMWSRAPCNFLAFHFSPGVLELPGFLKVFTLQRSLRVSACLLTVAVEDSEGLIIRLSPKHTSDDIRYPETMLKHVTVLVKRHEQDCTVQTLTRDRGCGCWFGSFRAIDCQSEAWPVMTCPP